MILKELRSMSLIQPRDTTHRSTDMSNKTNHISFIIFSHRSRSRPRLLAGGPSGILTSAIAPLGHSGCVTHADIPKIFPRCPPRYPSDIPKISPKLPKISQRYPQHIPQIHFSYIQDIPKKCPG